MSLYRVKRRLLEFRFPLLAIFRVALLHVAHTLQAQALANYMYYSPFGALLAHPAYEVA